ncbi:hypothetical protein Tco_0876239 [Tanacetum coccineum]|uniref:Uncharacterized protein n=1 Tax=Tanacetum coccineum TaxID=301880 RepID=A0ABQ5BUU2_9ASTR
MDMLAISISTDSPGESEGNTIEIEVDIIHPIPVTSATFPTSTMMARLAEQEETIYNMHEELRVLREGGEMAELERASLRATVRLFGAEGKWLSGRLKDERGFHAKMGRQMVLIQEELEHLKRSRKLIAAKPTRLQDANRIANNLMDQKPKGYAARNAEKKRRFDNNPRDNRVPQPPLNRQSVARTYTELQEGMDKTKITRKQSKASKHGHENQKSTKPKPQKTKALANFHLQGPFLQFPKVIYNLKERKERRGPNVQSFQTTTVLTVKKGAGTPFTIHRLPQFHPHGKTRGKSKLEGALVNSRKRKHK